MTRADSTFVNDRHEAQAYDDRHGTALGRIHITRRFEGDLEGSATAALLTATTESGAAVYVALDRFEGSLHGREGSFVIHHRGTLSAEGAVVDGGVVPGSGTGELRGIRGSVTIVVDENGSHQLVLDDELEDR